MTVEPGVVFRRSNGTGVAPYRQLIDQVQKAISSGQLKPGDQLPPVREVMTQITINPNTVYRAYRELEHLGVVATRWGVGTFVKTPAPDESELAQAATIDEGLSGWINSARVSGSDDEQIIEVVRAALHDTMRMTRD
jgi:GntR family transcriptional regulator